MSKEKSKMNFIETGEAYKVHFKKNFGAVSWELMDYINDQFNQLDNLLEIISQESFWSVIPKILGIDAKLSLITELIQFEDFCHTDIIRIVETDYRTYYKELCGYDLSMETKHSLVFNVS